MPVIDQTYLVVRFAFPYLPRRERRTNAADADEVFGMENMLDLDNDIFGGVEATTSQCVALESGDFSRKMPTVRSGWGAKIIIIHLFQIISSELNKKSYKIEVVFYRCQM